MTRVVLGALALALPLVALTAPVDAAETASASVSGIDGVLYDDCRDYPYGYSVTDVPDGAVSWDLEVSLLGPDGREADTDFVALPGPTGTSSFTLCPPADTHGTYTIRAAFEWQDAEMVWHASPLADAHFSMRKPFTRTRLTVSTHRPSYGQLVTYRIRVWDERPEGYVATAFAWVRLQKRVDGHWVRIKGTRTLTHSTGRVTLRLRYLHHHRRMKVRSVAEASPRFSRSVSPAVRLW